MCCGVAFTDLFITSCIMWFLISNLVDFCTCFVQSTYETVRFCYLLLILFIKHKNCVSNSLDLNEV